MTRLEMKTTRSWRSSKKEGNFKKDDKQQSKEVSKKIKKCINDKKGSRRQENIQQILEEFKGIKNISCIKSAKQRTLNPKIKKRKRRSNHINKMKLPMSLVNSTSSCMHKNSVKKRNMTFTEQIQEQKRRQNQ